MDGRSTADAMELKIEINDLNRQLEEKRGRIEELELQVSIEIYVLITETSVGRSSLRLVLYEILYAKNFPWASNYYCHMKSYTFNCSSFF